MMYPVIETERLIMTRPDGSDWPDYLATYTGPRGRYIGGPLSATKAWMMMAGEVGHWQILGYGMFKLADKVTSDSLGFAGPFRPATWPENELGWILWDRAEGKGFAFEAMIAIRRWVYENLAWSTAVSYIDPANTRSITLAERLGCVRDDAAPRVDAEDLVYRHPGPAEVLG